MLKGRPKNVSSSWIAGGRDDTDAFPSDAVGFWIGRAGFIDILLEYCETEEEADGLACGATTA